MASVLNDKDLEELPPQVKQQYLQQRLAAHQQSLLEVLMAEAEIKQSSDGSPKDRQAAIGQLAVKEKSLRSAIQLVRDELNQLQG